MIQAISTHVETEFATWKRYKSHIAPNDMRGVLLLQEAYQNAGIHVTHHGRRAPDTEKVEDLYNIGLATLGKPTAR